jgi:hypothetical protein
MKLVLEIDRLEFLKELRQCYREVPSIKVPVIVVEDQAGNCKVIDSSK